MAYWVCSNIYCWSPANALPGPTLGPALGGFINEYADWRWSFYTLIIWSAVNVILLALLVPETYAPKLMKDEAAKLRERTSQQQWWARLEVTDRSVSRTVLRSCIRPIQLLYYEHMCLNLCLLSALLLAVLYLFFGVRPARDSQECGTNADRVTGVSSDILYKLRFQVMANRPDILWIVCGYDSRGLL